MNTYQTRRYLYYFSLFKPIYELFSLKNDHRYARQRFCSMDYLKDNNIVPVFGDYDLKEIDSYNEDEIDEKSLEKMITKKNCYQKNCISVGDIINVIHKGNHTSFFVDGIGLKIIEFKS